MMTFAEELLGHVLDPLAEAGALHYQDNEIGVVRPWPRLPLDQALVDLGGLEPEVVANEAALRQHLSAHDVNTDGLGHGAMKERALDQFRQIAAAVARLHHRFPARDLAAVKGSPRAAGSG